MTTEWNPEKNIPSLHGKIAVITGANSDIGRETARYLALNGAKVYLAVRSEAKGVQTRRLILDKTPEIEPQNLQWVKIDLTDMRSITAAVNWLKTQEQRLDLLIHNAAAATWSNEPVGAGWEPHMAVNFIGPFALTNRLLPLLQSAAAEKGADVRIITLTSTAQVAMLPIGFKFPFTSLDCLRNPVPSHPWQWRYFGKFAFGFDMIRYAVSKAANLIFAQELQRRLDKQGLPIISVAVHPGEVATEGVFSINNAMVRTFARLTFLSPEQGAATSLFAAASRDVKENPAAYKGRFLLPVGKIGVPASVALDEEQVRGLWNSAMEEVNRRLADESLPPLQAW
ncbi:daunorubicin c-13 ketoreductase [Colletotrichum chrysophilum]|uniref:Daunorubicin c-13 ketoreductase n=1 Tax=Colletotrichum chrysophilum TaxID=1836956 RepID=A0AAD9E9M4_9PEZI|nr:daunorubicin c-13 ketoreductase [Colletotrichum chrysophilum]